MVTVYRDKKPIILTVQNILFVETDKRKIHITTRHKKYENIEMSLEAFINLTDNYNIVRCHRCYAVNVENIEHFQKIYNGLAHIYFKDKPKELFCPVSRTYYKKIKSMSSKPQ